MHWVTPSHVHLDRVASAWLIRRFVDPEATFGFVAAGTEPPPDAIPFAIPGAALGPHDAEGSCFRKILTSRDIQRPELDRLADIVEAGVAIAMHQDTDRFSPDLIALADGLAAFSEAMVVLRSDDRWNLEDSAAIYDGLYVTLWQRYGEGPDLPKDLRERLLALRTARDWSALLPRWPRLDPVSS